MCKLNLIETECNFLIQQMMMRCGRATTVSHAQWIEDAVEYATKATDGSPAEVMTMVDKMIVDYCDSINELSVVDSVASKELYNGSFAYAEGIGALGNW